MQSGPKIPPLAQKNANATITMKNIHANKIPVAPYATSPPAPFSLLS